MALNEQPLPPQPVPEHVVDLLPKPRQFGEVGGRGPRVPSRRPVIPVDWFRRGPFGGGTVFLRSAEVEEDL